MERGPGPLPRHLVRQAAAAPAGLPALGRGAGWLLRLAGALYGLLACALAWLFARDLWGGAKRARRGAAGVLPHLRHPLGGHPAGRRPADAGPAPRGRLAGPPAPRLLERRLRRRGVPGQSQGPLRAGGVRALVPRRHPAARLPASLAVNGAALAWLWRAGALVPYYRPGVEVGTPLRRPRPSSPTRSATACSARSTGPASTPPSSSPPWSALCDEGRRHALAWAAWLAALPRPPWRGLALLPALLLPTAAGRWCCWPRADSPSCRAATPASWPLAAADPAGALRPALRPARRRAVRATGPTPPWTATAAPPPPSPAPSPAPATRCSSGASVPNSTSTPACPRPRAFSIPSRSPASPPTATSPQSQAGRARPGAAHRRAELADPAPAFILDGLGPTTRRWPSPTTRTSGLADATTARWRAHRDRDLPTAGGAEPVDKHRSPRRRGDAEKSVAEARARVPKPVQLEKAAISGAVTPFVRTRNP